MAKRGLGVPSYLTADTSLTASERTITNVDFVESHADQGRRHGSFSVTTRSRFYLVSVPGPQLVHLPMSGYSKSELYS
jgi:hypothetical protein